ncbi:MAG: hypothetical protein ACLSB9_20655 [Hydrogeniiclostridium mannosilyticum]
MDYLVKMLRTYVLMMRRPPYMANQGTRGIIINITHRGLMSPGDAIAVIKVS